MPLPLNQQERSESQENTLWWRAQLPFHRMRQMLMGATCFVMAALLVIAGGVQAASEASMKKAYSSHVYRIENMNSKKYLDVLGQSMEDGAQVGQWDDDPGDQQRWLIMPVPGGGGKVYIINVHSGAFLDVLGASKESGAGVGQYSYQDPKTTPPPVSGEQQQWRLGSTPDDYVRIENEYSELYLDVWGASKDDGAPVVQYTVTDPGDQQKWKLVRGSALKLPDLKTERFPKSPPALTRDSTPPATRAYVVHKELVPFFQVKDRKSRDWLASNSPYFLLTLSKQWKAGKNEENPNPEEPIELEITKRQSNSSTVQREVQETVSVSASTSARWGWGSANIQANASREETNMQSAEAANEDEQDRRFEVAPGTKVQAWQVQRKYTLTRVYQGKEEGALVKEWDDWEGKIYLNQAPFPIRTTK